MKKLYEVCDEIQRWLLEDRRAGLRLVLSLLAFMTVMYMIARWSDIPAPIGGKGDARPGGDSLVDHTQYQYQSLQIAIEQNQAAMLSALVAVSNRCGCDTVRPKPPAPPVIRKRKHRPYVSKESGCCCCRCISLHHDPTGDCSWLMDRNIHLQRELMECWSDSARQKATDSRDR